jgi:hypothetical protein
MLPKGVLPLAAAEAATAAAARLHACMRLLLLPLLLLGCPQPVMSLPGEADLYMSKLGRSNWSNVDWSNWSTWSCISKSSSSLLQHVTA